MNPTTVGFTGHVNDADTGLVYMQQRYYEPYAGRFLSVDPVTTDAKTGSSFNRYVYGNSNPYKFKDPDGRFAETLWDIASLALSVNEFRSSPSIGNAIGVAVDAAAVVIPGIPGGVGAVRAADRAADAVKVGAAGGLRAGKAHTPAANRLGREQNKAEHGGKMVCPTCGKKMNEPVQSQKGVPVDRDAAVGDHLHPRSQGGDGATVKDMTNHETKCWQCNHEKRDTLPSQ